MEVGASACPGCRVVLPVSDWPVDSRANVSPACWQIRSNVLAHELEHLLELGRFHQLSVDAYAAQHAGDRVPPIATAFALIGLHLALDEGWPGTAVRAAHQHLAQRFHEWLVFAPPTDPGWLTIADVAASQTAHEHSERVQAWARSVWEAWSTDHDRVRAWADDALPADIRGRLRQA
jgi:hypothetical protein